MPVPRMNFSQAIVAVARRAAVGLVFIRGRSARCLAEVFLRQSCDPLACLRLELRAQNVRCGCSNPAPVEALDRQHGLFAVSEYVGVGNRQSELAHQLRAEPLVFHRV